MDACTKAEYYCGELQRRDCDWLVCLLSCRLCACHGHDTTAAESASELHYSSRPFAAGELAVASELHQSSTAGHDFAGGIMLPQGVARRC